MWSVVWSCNFKDISQAVEHTTSCLKRIFPRDYHTVYISTRILLLEESHIWLVDTFTRQHMHATFDWNMLYKPVAVPLNCRTSMKQLCLILFLPKNLLMQPRYMFTQSIFTLLPLQSKKHLSSCTCAIATQEQIKAISSLQLYVSFTKLYNSNQKLLITHIHIQTLTLSCQISCLL